MAQQDKTDWYWNGVLAGAVNNLYYDLINVDVVHVPYATMNRNSSFFLQTRMNYSTSNSWDVPGPHRGWDVVDVKYIWDDNCKYSKGDVYVLLADKSRKKIRIHNAPIENGCVGNFDWSRTNGREYSVSGCGAFRLFTTDFVKGQKQSPGDIKIDTGKGTPEQCCEKNHCGDTYSCGIQINKYEGGIMHGYFSDVNVENGTQRFVGVGEDTDYPELGFSVGDYILVYKSLGRKDDGFAGQVRMITGIEDGRLMVDAPWQGFKTLEGEGEEVQGGGLGYYIFSDWGEVVGFTQGRNIYIVNDASSTLDKYEVYDQTGLKYTNIISVTSAADKVFVLTDNGYVHYSNYTGYDKFFIQDDVYVGADKTSIASYKDIIIAFGNKHIAVGVPDEDNTYTTMYNQSATVGLWSRYSYAEYDGDMIFVSNDKRLLALGIASNTGKYMLQYEDVGDMLNGKLSTLVSGDEIFLGNDGNDLKIYLRTKSKPYYNEDGDWQALLTTRGKYEQKNSMTRIFKFNKQFKVWTEDWIQGILIQGTEGGMAFGEDGLYARGRGYRDVKGGKELTYYDFRTHISAYLMENESDWIGGNNSWLANRPKLYNLSKLNRVITTLGPGEYSHDTKLKITSYVKGLGSVYEFSIDGDNNDWIGLISTKFLGEDFSDKDEEKLECMSSVIQDSQKKYQPKCVGTPNAAIQNLAQKEPWCELHGELLVLDKGVCIDDSLYELAPTMPLVTELGENQSYATQIKLELVGGIGDIITFGGWLCEMFIAPLFTKGPDGEYQLQPNTDC